MRIETYEPNILPFRILNQKLDAQLYNTLRLGMLRISNPLTVSFEESHNFICCLSNHKWILKHKLIDEYPLVIWRDFENKNRALHEAVSCKAYVYHMMAGRLMGTSLYMTADYVTEALKAHDIQYQQVL